MLADYCWNVFRYDLAAEYKRQAKKYLADTESKKLVVLSDF